MNTLLEKPADSKTWDEAFLRVESYLHAHRVQSVVLLNQLTTEIIAEARARAEQQPGEPPVALAMRIAHERIASWFRSVVEDANWSEERLKARGRLALLMTNMSSSWSTQFLTSETISSELVQAMKKSTLQPGPEIRLSNMAPAPLEFAFGDTDESAPLVNRWATYPAVAVSILLIGVMAAAWTATH